MKEHCYVHKNLQCKIRGPLEQFLVFFSYFRFFDPILARSPLYFSLCGSHIRFPPFDLDHPSFPFSASYCYHEKF